MDAELMHIRKNQQLDRRVDGEITKINQEELMNKCYAMNTNMTYLYGQRNNPDVAIDEYVEKIVDNIYLILEMFNTMGVYPDYFYDILFRVNDEYRTLASQGRVDGRKSLYQTVEYPSKISAMMERGIRAGNYQLNPTKIRNIDIYYNDMLEFLEKHYLPHNVNTIEMCKEMFSYIYFDVNECINNKLSNSHYISDDIEALSRLLFNYLLFFGAIGVNPKEYLNECIWKHNELGKSK